MNNIGYRGAGKFSLIALTEEMKWMAKVKIKRRIGYVV